VGRFLWPGVDHGIEFPSGLVDSESGLLLSPRNIWNPTHKTNPASCLAGSVARLGKTVTRPGTCFGADIC
jgi:hypothetical protein